MPARPEEQGDTFLGEAVAPVPNVIPFVGFITMVIPLVLRPAEKRQGMVLIVRAQEARGELAALLVDDSVRNGEPHRVDVEVDHRFQLRGLEDHVLQAPRHARKETPWRAARDAEYCLPALRVADLEGTGFEQRRVDSVNRAAAFGQARAQQAQAGGAAQVIRRREQAAMVGGRNQHGPLRALEQPAAISLRLAVHVQQASIEIDLLLWRFACQVQVTQAGGGGSLQGLHKHLWV